MTAPRRAWWRAPFLSPRGLVLRAVALALFDAALSLAGGRARAGFLSGTPVGGWGPTALGVSYVVAHFAFVVLAPIFAIAAALLALCTRITTRAGETPPRS